MLNIFKTGDRKHYEKQVTEADTATFEAGQVHPVYSTFALARDVEWACRLFVLEMKEEDEEGIGTFINVDHKNPALVGETVEFEAVIKSIKGHEVICDYQAKVGQRLIARGEQGQKILKKEKLKAMMAQLRKE